MTKQFNFRTGMVAIAIMILCTLQGLAQVVKPTGKEISTASARSAPKKLSAAEELRNFKPDPQNAQLSEMRLNVLQTKAALEKGTADKSLNEKQIADMKAKISVM